MMPSQNRVRIRRRRFRAAATLAVTGALVLVGCGRADIDPAKRAIVREVLREDADHLDRSTRRRIALSLLTVEAEHDVDALLLLAVVEQESRFEPRARSRRGALGLMQIRPTTARAVAGRHRIPYGGADDLYDPAVSVAIGAAYLAELERAFGSWELALAAYHRGPTKVRRATAAGRPIRSRYAARVMGRVRELRERLDAGSY